MRRSRPLPVVALVIALLAALVVARQAATRADATAPGHRDRSGALSFQPAIAALDRQAVLTGIAAARPEAREVIDAIDGLVDVRIGAVGGRGVGLTEGAGERYMVTLDLATVSRRYGARGIARLVLHELGHVIDHELVGPDLAARLDAEIPRGWGCANGTGGACASREERFAESFAKWATGDIGVDLYLGYRVPPPSSLESWGRPLAELAARASS